MVQVEDEIVIRGPIDTVFACFWNAELWPKVTTHVKQIEMIEQSPDSQRFRMTVESKGRDYTVETQRWSVRNRRITYWQPRPPEFLRRHTGEWKFFVNADGVRIRLVHEAEIDETKLGLIGADRLDEAEAIVGNSLKANGMATMSSIKQHIERL